LSPRSDLDSAVEIVKVLKDAGKIKSCDEKPQQKPVAEPVAKPVENPVQKPEGGKPTGFVDPWAYPYSPVVLPQYELYPLETPFYEPYVDPVTGVEEVFEEPIEEYDGWSTWALGGAAVGLGVVTVVAGVATVALVICPFDGPVGDVAAGGTTIASGTGTLGFGAAFFARFGLGAAARTVLVEGATYTTATGTTLTLVEGGAATTTAVTSGAGWSQAAGVVLAVGGSGTLLYSPEAGAAEFYNEYGMYIDGCEEETMDLEYCHPSIDPETYYGDRDTDTTFGNSDTESVSLDKPFFTASSDKIIPGISSFLAPPAIHSPII